MRMIGEMMKDAQACATKAEARELVRNEIAGLVTASPLLLEEEARGIVLGNIGYMSGYCNRAEAARLLELFETRHPYFGAIEDWPKTPEETIAMGFKVGMRARSQGLKNSGTQAPEHLSAGGAR